MPITAMRQIIEALATEGTTPKHNYFDPQAKFVEIKSIGGDPIILANPPRGDAGLVDGRSWRLRATPIPEGQEEEEEKDEELKEKEEEAYTMMQIHDSGVASFMEMKSGITTIHAELVEVKQLPIIDCSRPKPPEPEISQDCIDGKPVRKEDDLAEGETPESESEAEEGTKTLDLLADAPSEDSAKETDCEVVVEKEDSIEGEEVEAAPVGEVEAEPSGEFTEPEEAEEPTETEEPQETDEATQPELFNASVTSDGN
jgi:hypothetical protein